MAVGGRLELKSVGTISKEIEAEWKTELVQLPCDFKDSVSAFVSG